jgi:hypothetical protein
MEKESFRNRGHSGIDFFMDEGTILRTIRDGKVERIVDFGEKVNAGKCVMIKWEDGKTAIYGHLSKFKENLSEGDTVRVGDVIGYSGHSGHVVGKTGNHLHFGLKENGKFIDPSEYINDIQHMNDVNYFVQKIPEVTQVKVSFFEYMQQHMSGVSDALVDMKLNFINTLTNDVIIIKVLEQLFQLISGHASLLYHIVTCII